jgi:membrane-bound metal-dependent hydrolase YbcI (DUF457 family)
LAVSLGRGKHSIKKNFFIYSGQYCSHLLLDYISVDGRAPFGIPIFWPLSDNYLIFPYPILPPIWHSAVTDATLSQFLAGAFCLHNLYVIFLEFVIMLPFILVLRQESSYTDY